MTSDLAQWVVFGAGGTIIATALGWVMRRVVDIAIVQRDHAALVQKVETQKETLEHKISDLWKALARAEGEAERIREDSRERDKTLFTKVDDLTKALNTFNERMAGIEGVLDALKEVTARDRSAKD